MLSALILTLKVFSHTKSGQDVANPHIKITKKTYTSYQLIENVKGVRICMDQNLYGPLLTNVLKNS